MKVDRGHYQISTNFTLIMKCRNIMLPLSLIGMDLVEDMCIVSTRMRGHTQFSQALKQHMFLSTVTPRAKLNN